MLVFYPWKPFITPKGGIPYGKNTYARHWTVRNFFSSLNIRLGIMKQYAKAFDIQGDHYRYICANFPGFTYEK